MGTNSREELVQIMTKFAESGWDLIDAPSKAWLEGNGDKDKLIAAIEQADKECGSCGCEFDPLYKKALSLKELL
jgi:cytochrome c556